MTFGSRLRYLRISKGMRQEDLAKAFKVHRATIGKYEGDERFPDKMTLLAIADYFDVSLDYLFGRSNTINPNTLLEKQDEYYFDLTSLSPEETEKIRKYIASFKRKRRASK